MKLEIETPRHLIDVNGLGLDKIENTQDGGLRIGALVRNTALAADMRVRRDYGVLSRALLAGASGQLRNKATTAGNLLQRTRCPYFYDTNQPCNKRSPGSGCAAIEGVSRQLGVIGVERMRASRPTPPTWPSPCARSTLRWRPSTTGGETRKIPIAEFHRLPGDTPHIETTLAAGRTDHRGDAAASDRRNAYLQEGPRPRVLRFRAGLRRGGRCSATGPDGWRSAASPTSRGGSKRPKPSCRKGAKPFSARLLADAKPTNDNAFKVPLVERTVAAAMNEARQR